MTNLRPSEARDWLAAVVSAYGPEAINRIQWDTKTKDDMAIVAIAGGTDRNNRIAAVAHWIAFYKVHRAPWGGNNGSFPNAWRYAP